MEKHLEAKLRKQIRRRGGQCLKWTSPGTTGVPDRIIIMPGGKVYFREMKYGKGRLRPRQLVVIEMLKALGADVAVISNDEELNSFLAELDFV